MTKKEENFDLIRQEEDEIAIEKFVSLDFLQDDGKMFDLIDMDLLELKNILLLKNWLTLWTFFGNCGSGILELFGDDHFDKNANYDFVFLGTYVGSKYGNSCDEWLCMNKYFDPKEIICKIQSAIHCHE